MKEVSVRDAYYDLCCAVIVQAISDYTYLKEGRLPYAQQWTKSFTFKGSIDQLMMFFASPWRFELVGVDYDWLMRIVEKKTNEDCALYFKEMNRRAGRSESDTGDR